MTGESTSASSYDQVPYESLPFPQTHPDRLAALAKLFALNPPPLERCRVLELGCAAGGNLIPMAVAMPGAEFLGIDLSEVQVAQGQGVIDALNLGNVRLQALSITALDESVGSFDYIISHGVYSWVPNEVQEKILEICARQLAPNGVAYVSYNTLPGWRMRGMIRDLMRYHAMQFSEPDARVAQARAILDFLAKWVPAENNAYGILLKSELETLRRQPDYYILHEHLEDINEPLYFHQFTERAARHGLQYLAEADFSTMLASRFPPEVAETLVRIGPDVVRQEQFMDFLRNRTFRQTLLVRSEMSPDRKLTPDRVTSLWVSGSLAPTSPRPDLQSTTPEEFRVANGGSLRTPNAVTKAAVVVLADRWPKALAFPDLLREAQIMLQGQSRDAIGANDAMEAVLASDVLQCYAAGLMQLHAVPSPFATVPGERPHASPLARFQIRHGTTVTNLRHERVTLDKELGRILQLLDGSRRPADIERSMTDWAAVTAAGKGRVRKDLPGVVREQVATALQHFSKLALLT